MLPSQLPEVSAARAEMELRPLPLSFAVACEFALRPAVVRVAARRVMRVLLVCGVVRVVASVMRVRSMMVLMHGVVRRL